MGYSFDGATKIIQLSTGTVFVDVQDLYSRWVDWLTVSDNLKYQQAMRAVGGDPLPGSKALGLTYFLMNGWKIRPDEANHVLNINGNLYCEDGSSPYIATIGSYNVMLISSVSSLVDSTVQQLPEIEHGMFQNMVTIDATNGAAGTDYPKGTPQYPVNNLADAKTIAVLRGFDRLYIKGNFTIGATESVSTYTLIGTGPENTNLTLTTGCTTSKTDFQNMSVSGRQSGETHYHGCDIGYLTNVHCIFDRCRLIGPMEMHQSYADTTVFFQCYTGDIAGADTVIDLNNSPVNMSFNDFNGKMKFVNMNKATAGVVTVNGNAGKITIDSTCTTGTIKVRGCMEVIDNSTGTTVDNDVVSSLVWQRPVEGLFTAEEVMRLLAAAMAGKVSGADGATITFRDIADTKNRITATVDADGNRTAVTHDVQ